MPITKHEGAGLLWVNSKITSAKVTPSAFNTWYDTIHLPDILKTGAFSLAARYTSLDPAAATPYLAVYAAPDRTFLGSPEFSAIPVKDSTYFPGPSHLCYDYADFDTRFYELIEMFEVEGARPGPARLIISAELEPAEGADDDFNAWYNDEHYATLAACPGYVRTRRYKLMTKTRPVPGELPIRFLALHEFDGESLPREALQRTAETPWAARTMGSLRAQEVGVYELHGVWGRVKARF